MNKQSKPPSQPTNPLIRNDIQLKSAVDKVSKIHDLSFMSRALLLEVVSRFAKGEDLFKAVRYESQYKYADAIRCSVSTIKRAEKDLCLMGLLSKEACRTKDRMRKLRKLRLGPQFFLALMVIKPAKNPKKPNDLPKGHPDPCLRVRVNHELIHNSVNTHNNIGNTPKRHEMAPDMKKTDAVFNSKKPDYSSLVRGLCESPKPKAVDSRVCDITDEFFPKSGEGFIEWKTINPAIARLVVLRGYSGVRADLGKILEGKPIADRLEISGRVFKYLEDSYK